LEKGCFDPGKPEQPLYSTFKSGSLKETFYSLKTKIHKNQAKRLQEKQNSSLQSENLLQYLFNRVRKRNRYRRKKISRKPLPFKIQIDISVITSIFRTYHPQMYYILLL